MPKVYKVLSSKEVINILEKFGFYKKAQKGSHIKMYYSGEFVRGSVIVPERREIPQGTMRAILRQAGQFVDEVELEKHFKN